MSTRRSKTSDRPTARRGSARRTFAFEPLEGRSLLSGTDIAPSFGNAWTPNAGTDSAASADYVVTTTPQHLMVAAMRGRMTFPAAFDTAAFDATAVGTITFNASAFGIPTFAGIGAGEQSNFAWPAFAPRFGSVLVSTPSISAAPYVTKALIYHDGTDAGLTCVFVHCGTNAGDAGTSLTVSRLSLSGLGNDDPFASVDRAFDVKHGGGIYVWQLSSLKTLEQTPFEAWIARYAMGSVDAASYYDMLGEEWNAGDGKLIAGRERPAGTLPMLPPILGGSLIVGGANDADHDGGQNTIDGEQGGFIGLSTMSDFAPSVSNAFAMAAERGATNDVRSLAPAPALDANASAEVPGGILTPMSLHTDTVADKAADAPRTFEPGRVDVGESDIRGLRTNDRTIARPEGGIIANAIGDAPATPNDGNSTRPNEANVQADEIFEHGHAANASGAEMDERLLATADGEGGLIALAVATLPSEPISIHSAAEAWYVEDARPQAIASTDAVRFESSVGLFQVFDVAAAMPVVDATDDQAETVPRPTMETASLFASLRGLGGGAEPAEANLQSDDDNARVEEATVGADAAIAAAAAAVLSAGLSLRRKGPLAKLRALFERWPRRVRNRRATRSE